MKSIESDPIDYCKQRWQVELFFKWIKQNLQIKAFVGLSKNAVMTQIWIAMCMCLLLAYLKFSNKVNASMQQILRLICVNLFAKRDLLTLIKPEAPPQNQAICRGCYVNQKLWDSSESDPIDSVIYRQRYIAQK